MNDFEKINTDLATLFREGRALLDAGNSAVMNGCREEAFRKFVDLGGIPNKQEDYIYLNLLPLFGKDYNVVLKYIRQEVDMNDFPLCCYGFGYHSRIDRERLVVRWESGSRNTGGSGYLWFAGSECEIP